MAAARDVEAVSPVAAKGVAVVPLLTEMAPPPAPMGVSKADGRAPAAVG